jgi:hypothetical protein
VHGDRLLEWSPFGYARRRNRPTSATVTLLTPPSMVQVIRAGYGPPAVHPTAVEG